MARGLAERIQGTSAFLFGWADAPLQRGLAQRRKEMGWFKKKGPDLRDIRPDVGSQPIRQFGVTGESRLAWSESKRRSGLIIVQVQVRHTATEKCTPVQSQSIFKGWFRIYWTKDLISKLAECRLYQWRQQQISVLYSGGMTFSFIYLLLSLPLRESKILPLHQKSGVIIDLFHCTVERVRLLFTGRLAETIALA